MYFTVHHNNNGQSYRHLSGCHYHDKKYHQLGVRIIVHLGERDQQKIYGIQHQLNAHKDDNGVPAHQCTGDTDTEQGQAEE